MGRLLRVLDYVAHCYTNVDGDVIQHLIRNSFSANQPVIVSFDDVDSVSTSFVNSAFIELMDTYSFEYIRSNLNFINSTRAINDVIKRRFLFEVNERKNLVNV